MSEVISLCRVLTPCSSDYMSASMFSRFEMAKWNPLPFEIIEFMKGKSLPFDMPESLPPALQNIENKLTYMQLDHYNFNGETQQGELIIRSCLVEKITNVFERLFENRFPIKKMRLISHYDGDDNKSMEDNNSSAFNFRPIAGTSRFSMHAYGVAFDINPLFNPFHKEDTILPHGSERYLKRSLNEMGMIKKGNVCYQAFIEEGFKWGGEWSSLKDYQHFEYPLDLLQELEV